MPWLHQVRIATFTVSAKEFFQRRFGVTIRVLKTVLKLLLFFLKPFTCHDYRLEVMKNSHNVVFIVAYFPNVMYQTIYACMHLIKILLKTFFLHNSKSVSIGKHRKLSNHGKNDELVS